jgi:hypothetical protein
MRKLLLTTTALVAAGAMSTAATASDFSISGNYKWSYDERDSGINTAGESGDRMYTEQNITMNWVNKTDAGLEISMHAAINSEGAGGNASESIRNEENAIKIKGGFGTIQLGSDDGAGDQLTRTAHDIFGTPDALHGDLPAFHRTGTDGNLADDNADLNHDIDDEANITYILPKMGGLTIGASYRDAGSGASENADETEVAAKFDFSAGDVNGSLHYGQNSMDGATVGATGLDASSMAIDVSMGNIRAVYATAQRDVSATVETEITDFGVSYKVNDGLTVAVVQTEVDENTGGETLDVTSIGATYTIVSGLTASLSYHDYDYKAGSSSETNDDGSNTTLSIVATF